MILESPSIREDAQIVSSSTIDIETTNDQPATFLVSKLGSMRHRGLLHGLKSPRVVALFLFAVAIGCIFGAVFSPWSILVFDTVRPPGHDPFFQFSYDSYQLSNFDDTLCPGLNKVYGYSQRPCGLSLSTFSDMYHGCDGLIRDAKKRIEPAVRLLIAVLVGCVFGFGAVLLWISHPYRKIWLFSLIGIVAMLAALTVPAPVVFSDDIDYFQIRCFRELAFQQNSTMLSVDDADNFSAVTGVSFILCFIVLCSFLLLMVYLLLEVKAVQTKLSVISFMQSFEDKTNRLRTVMNASGKQLEGLLYEVRVLGDLQTSLSSRLDESVSDEDRERLQSELENVIRSLESTKQRIDAQSTMQDYFAQDQAKMMSELSSKLESLGESQSTFMNVLQQKLTVIDSEMEQNLRTTHLNRQAFLDAKINRLHPTRDAAQIELLRKQKVTAEREAADRERLLDATISPHLRRFYLVFQSKLNSIFEASRVLSTGMVARRQNTKTDIAANAINLAGKLIPLPGFHFFASATGMAFVAYADKREYKQATAQGSVFVSTSQMNELVEDVAFRLVCKWEEPLYDVFVGSAYWMDEIVCIAERAIYAILKWIRAQEEGSSTAYCDDMVSLCDQFVEAATSAVAVKPDPNFAEKFLRNGKR